MDNRSGDDTDSDVALQLLGDMRSQTFPRLILSIHPIDIMTSLLSRAPTVTGKLNVANDILHCAKGPDDVPESLTKLAEFYFNNLLVYSISPVGPFSHDSAFSRR